jgi:ammonium transporter Rh
MSDQQNESSAATPLLPPGESANASLSTPASPKKEPTKSASASVHETQVVITAVSPSSPHKAPRPLSAVSAQKGDSASAAPAQNEYRFVHQRIPNKQGKLRFFLPIILLSLQVLFIVLFALFVEYDNTSQQHRYPQFIDLHALLLVGFGFLMTFLKRYGYGSIGFTVLLVALVLQWALIIRGWVEGNNGQQSFNASFSVGLSSLVKADLTAVAVLVTLGALVGKTTLTQLVVLAVIEVVIQVFNEYINIHLINTYDVGRSVYVHLFGALFGLAASKFLHCDGVQSTKQAPVYHSDLFALVGTLFLWVFYPSFNSILAQSENEYLNRAVINTVAALAASTVVTFGVSSLAGKGKLSILHVQHATIAGGIAIGSVADLNVQIYVALIVGSAAGLLSTIGYQYIDSFLRRVLKIHDTVSVLSLHVLPGLIAAVLGAIFAACSTEREYSQKLYEIYPARANSTSSANDDKAEELIGRSGLEQAGFQLVGLAITLGTSIVFGALTGLLLRLPIFEQLSQDVEMFDDEAQWVTPDDYALKLTIAPAAAKKEEANGRAQHQDEKKEDTQV